MQLGKHHRQWLDQQYRQTSQLTQHPILSILGETINPGSTRTLDWKPANSLHGLDAPNRVLVVHGNNPGPTLCMTAAIHGDEINGIEIVRRVIHNVSPTKLKGTLIGVPIVNQDGFRRSSRYLSDRRDLNRHFPGNPKGSAASRLAYSLFHEVITHCHYLIDLHTGSFHRINLPQLRADLSRTSIHAFTKGFGGITVLNHEGLYGQFKACSHGRWHSYSNTRSWWPTALKQSRRGLWHQKLSKTRFIH